MMRGMFAAISGLKVHQMMLDVTANDIANVNTIGYKAERTSFKDALSPAPARRERAVRDRSAARTPPRSASASSSTRIDNLMTVGRHPVDRATRSTCAIQGDGFFRVTDDPTGLSATSYYTRAGNFTRDANGDLVTPGGLLRRRLHDRPGGRPTATRDHDHRPGEHASPSRSARTASSRPSTRRASSTRVAAISLAKFPNDQPASSASPATRFVASNNSGAPSDRRRRHDTASARSRRARSRCRTSTSPRSSPT